MSASLTLFYSHDLALNLADLHLLANLSSRSRPAGDLAKLIFACHDLAKLPLAKQLTACRDLAKPSQANLTMPLISLEVVVAMYFLGCFLW